MAAVTFDVAAFRAGYPAFAANPPTDETLQVYFNNGTGYINNQYPQCQGMNVAQLTQALYLMTAHLAAIAAGIAVGDTPGQVQGATIDKVTVTMTPPPNPNQWQWWLGTTPYGAQLLALLQAVSAGGFYFGGRFENNAMRRGGGYRGGGGNY